jgi:hypothetical protein
MKRKQMRQIVSVLAALCVASVAAAQRGRGAAPPPNFDVHDVSGYWELSFDSRRVPAPSLASTVTPAMRAAKRKQDEYATRWCNWIGMPAAMDATRPIDIRQGRREIVMNFETIATPRHIYLDRTKHVDADVYDTTTMGDSIGRWDGDTLIVDTVGIAGDKGLSAIPGGGFRTDSSHLVERYRLLNNGAVLEVSFTWTDPKVFRAPHTYQYRYYRAPASYEAQPPMWCDPFDEGRTAFLAGSGSTRVGTSSRSGTGK